MIPGLEYSIPQVPLYNSILQLYSAEEFFFILPFRDRRTVVD